MTKGLTAITLVGVALLFTGAGCFSSDKIAEKITEKAIEGAIEGEQDADIDITDNGLTFTDEETGDTLSFGEEVELPDGFPSDVPIMDDAAIVASSSSSSRGEHTATLTSKNFSKTEKFYTEQLVEEGWTIDDTSTLSIGSKITTITASKDTRTLTVGLYQSEEDEVSVIITVTDAGDEEEEDAAEEE